MVEVQVRGTVEGLPVKAGTIVAINLSAAPTPSRGLAFGKLKDLDGLGIEC